MESLSIEGAWSYTPRQFPDDRGTFLESFRGEEFAEGLGYRLDVAQVNCSVSRRGVVRGIHFADVPPGQAKYVSCVRGAILDVVVDIRAGSPTFGQWEGVRLDDHDRRSLFVAEGLGHGFIALTDDVTVLYLCSTGYAPGREHGINPMDPQIGIAWPVDEAGGTAILSDKDAAAPSLSEALASGLLPQYEDCKAYAEHLRTKG